MYDFCPNSIWNKKGRQSLLEIAGLSDDHSFHHEASVENLSWLRVVYNLFVLSYPEQAKLISNARPDGVGPGEMICFFLFDNITLGGKNAPCDLYLGEVPFLEIKAGKYTKYNHSVYDFKLSRDQSPSAQFAMKYCGQQTPELTIAHDGFVWTIDGEPIIVTEELGFEEQVHIKMNQKRENTVHRSRDQVVAIWKDMLFEEIGLEKTYAFLRTDTLEMLHLGPLTKDMVTHYRNHRNQPWARVYLPRE